MVSDYLGNRNDSALPSAHLFAGHTHRINNKRNLELVALEKSIAARSCHGSPDVRSFVAFASLAGAPCAAGAYQTQTVRTQKNGLPRGCGIKNIQSLGK